MVFTVQLWFSSYCYLKFLELLASQKSSFSSFPLLKWLKKIKKIKNHLKSPKLLSKSLL